MAIQVLTTFTRPGGTDLIDYYKDGLTIDVNSQGVLYVIKDEISIGVYASGTWSQAWKDNSRGVA